MPSKDMRLNGNLGLLPPPPLELLYWPNLNLKINFVLEMKVCAKVNGQKSF
jgi:hypothetical protein